MDTTVSTYTGNISDLAEGDFLVSQGTLDHAAQHGYEPLGRHVVTVLEDGRVRVTTGTSAKTPGAARRDASTQVLKAASPKLVGLVLRRA